MIGEPTSTESRDLNWRSFRMSNGVVTVKEGENKKKALEGALEKIDRQFGKGSIMRLGSKDAIVPVAAISTGSLGLDLATGIGGFPRGRIIEIFGPESSGKTT